MRHNEHSRAIEHEIALWPGVGVRFGARRKHREATLSYQGRERFVMYCSSPSDSRRGLKIKIAEVRRTLKELGAEKDG